MARSLCQEVRLLSAGTLKQIPETDAPAAAGVKGLKVLKTTQSGYEGFLKDKYTMLKDTRERIVATAITSTWRSVPLRCVPSQKWLICSRSCHDKLHRQCDKQLLPKQALAGGSHEAPLRRGSCTQADLAAGTRGQPTTTQRTRRP